MKPRTDPDPDPNPNTNPNPNPTPNLHPITLTRCVDTDRAEALDPFTQGDQAHRPALRKGPDGAVLTLTLTRTLTLTQP